MFYVWDLVSMMALTGEVLVVFWMEMDVLQSGDLKGLWRLFLDFRLFPHPFPLPLYLATGSLLLLLTLEISTVRRVGLGMAIGVGVEMGIGMSKRRLRRS